MIGILTEKPSAGRNFAKALGGFSGKYNGEQYVIVSARGHLYSFDMPENQVDDSLVDRYKSWSLSNLPWNEQDFSWQRTKVPDSSTTLKNIKDTLSKCDEIVIATDTDPTGEGELLAWEILDELRLTKKKFSRMYFVDESTKTLQKSFVRRKPIKSMNSDMDYVKAYYRTRWDYLSMQFTRIATYYGDGRSVLRQGRLKSAMVSIVGDGLKAVKEYKKIPFYQNKFKDENGNVYTNPNEPKYDKKKDVPVTYRESPVILDKTELKKKSPPKMLDLAGLSAELSSKGIKAKEVLTVYQKMYESQIVSYPRTEDKNITKEQFDELLPLAEKIASVVGVDTSLLTHKTPRSTHVKNKGTHGANRPGTNVPNSLDELKKYGNCAPLIYEILAKNYLATLAEDYEYYQQSGHLSNYPEFKGTANIPKSMGYKAIYDDSDDDKSTTNKPLGKVAAPFIFEGYPTKPPTPTMKWLIKQLEKNDVGTGATRTSIYADVTNEKYKYPLMIEKKGKLDLTTYGKMSYYLLKDTNIGSVKTTENLMKEMRDIADGNADPDELLQNMQQLVKEDIKTMERNSVTMKNEMNISNNTSSMVAKEKATGIWVATGEEISFNRVWAGHRFTDEEVEQLLNDETIIIRNLKSSKGSIFSVKGKLEEQEYNGKEFVGFQKIEFINDNSAKGNNAAAIGKCPHCGGDIVKGKYGYYCANRCGMNVAKVYGKVLSENQLKNLLNGKKISYTVKGNKTIALPEIVQNQYEGKTYYQWVTERG